MGLLGDIGKGIGFGIPAAFKNIRKGASKFMFGDKAKDSQRSLIGPEQMPLYEQMQAAAMGPGAGGAFGESADYYRNLLSNDSADFNAMAAPEMRRFNEEIIPGLSEQFAGMGAGGSGLTGSGFQNAAVNAGTDLSERLGAIRAQFRAQGAAGLQNLGQFGLGQFNENITEPAQPGFLEQAAPIVGAVGGAMVGGPGGAMAGYQAGQGIGNMFSRKGKSGPYGKPMNTGQQFPQGFRG